jgi:hypothetical protein
MVLPSVAVSNLNYTLSTITSTVFSEVIVFYQDNDIMEHTLRVPPTPYLRESRSMWKFLPHHSVSRVLRELCQTWDFKLVLCADIWGLLADFAVRELEWLVAVERFEGRLDDFPSRLLVTCSPQQFLPAPGEPMNPDVPTAKWVHAWAPQTKERQPRYY